MNERNLSHSLPAFGHCCFLLLHEPCYAFEGTHVADILGMAERKDGRNLGPSVSWEPHLEITYFCASSLLWDIEWSVVRSGVEQKLWAKRRGQVLSTSLTQFRKWPHCCSRGIRYVNRESLWVTHCSLGRYLRHGSWKWQMKSPLGDLLPIPKTEPHL